MKSGTPLLAAALALGLSACNNQDPANDTTGLSVDSTAVAHGIEGEHDAAASARGDMPSTGASQLAGPDRRALLAVEAVDLHEIAAAGDALARNVEGDVRDYAETLRDDHTRNLEATRRLMGGGMDGGYAATAARTPAATGTSEPVAADGAGTAQAAGDAAAAASAHRDTAMHDEPGLVAMRERHDAERARLEALDGDAFAAAWVDAMVTGHEEALARLDDELIPGATDERVAGHLRDTRAAIADHLDTARSLQADR